MCCVMPKRPPDPPTHAPRISPIAQVLRGRQGVRGSRDGSALLRRDTPAPVRALPGPCASLTLYGCQGNSLCGSGFLKQVNSCFLTVQDLLSVKIPRKRKAAYIHTYWQRSCKCQTLVSGQAFKLICHFGWSDPAWVEMGRRPRRKTKAN